MTPPIYETWTSALKRVESLKAVGIWPGIIPVHIHDRVFAYRLTYDPQFPLNQMTSRGWVKAP